MLGQDVRVDLHELEVSLRPRQDRIVLAGAVDVRRVRLREGTGGAAALEPVGAYELAPLTIAFPDRAGDPVRFFGLIRFRGVRPNISFDLRDLNGRLF
ncbi:MAG: hypothetical protein ACE5JG_09685, partial [Planctomycetota bacterium]